MQPGPIIYLQVIPTDSKGERWVTWCNERINETDQEFISKKIFDKICQHVAYESGCCPADMLVGWERPEGCMKSCKNQAAECWGLYFMDRGR